MTPVIIPVTEAIQLSILTEHDLDDLIHCIDDPEVIANTLTIPSPYKREHAEQFLAHVRDFIAEHGFQREWSIRYQDRLIGGIGVLYNHGVNSHRSEIGYWLAKDYRGKGITTAAIGALVNYLFNHTALIRIEAHVFIGNHASAKALEKNGFVLEGTTCATHLKDGEPRDTWQYALIKSNSPQPSSI